MGWMLVVSEDESFQREAIARVGAQRPVVGATGDTSARSLVRAVNVDTILVDALDDVGRRFLATLRSLPHQTLPGVDVVVVGPKHAAPTFATAPTLDEAIASDAVVAA